MFICGVCRHCTQEYEPQTIVDGVANCLMCAGRYDEYYALKDRNKERAKERKRQWHELVVSGTKLADLFNEDIVYVGQKHGKT